MSNASELTPEQKKALKEERRLKLEAERAANAPVKTEEVDKKAMKEQRRLKQEAERAAKQQTTTNASKKTSDFPAKPPLPVQQQQQRSVAPLEKQTAAKTSTKMAPRPEAQKKVPLFLHLKQYERTGLVLPEKRLIHPSVLALGLRYSELIIRGADARVVALFQAFAEVIRDFESPLKELQKELSFLFDFLSSNCRPHSITMGNGFNFLKRAIHLRRGDNEKAYILQRMKEYLRSSVFGAGQEIAKAGAKLIALEKDVILVFAWSSVVERVLVFAHQVSKKDFTVVVVGARPHQEGIALLQRLVKVGIKCRYGDLQSISYLLEQGVTKVFLGASALLNNGAVLSRAGTAMVAMMAKANHKSVFVFAGTHKFSELVLLDSIVYNELGDPEELLVDRTTSQTRGNVLADWRDLPTLKLLNLQYDVTAGEYVDVVVTEIGNLPVSSVPVILRERREREEAEQTVV